MIRLSDLKPAPGSVKRRKIVGRGPGSGHGKTATRGHKGQKARSGGKVPSNFIGGQMKLFRLFPKRGFKHPKAVSWGVVNLRQLTKFSNGAVVGPEEMYAQGWIIRGECVKVLGSGELNVPLTVRAHAFSSAAKRKIEKVGGKAEVL